MLCGPYLLDRIGCLLFTVGGGRCWHVRGPLVSGMTTILAAILVCVFKGILFALEFAKLIRLASIGD